MHLVIGKLRDARQIKRMPLVSVVTPFHNTAEFLGQCIESVLGQSFGDFEYLLVDNASTDGSLEIAQAFSAADSRVKVIHFDELLPQVQNYNRALRLADRTATFCKIAQADDLLLPHCLDEMVRLAESDHDIGIVGAYTILQNRVFLDGLDFYERVIPGDEICRRYFLGGPYLFGSPTTHLYRMRDVAEAQSFYSETSAVEDADVALRLMLRRKFGFVHQVLTFSRRSHESISSRQKTYNVDVLTRRVLLEAYGPSVLDDRDFRKLRRRVRHWHNRVLGEGLIRRLGRPFWQLHATGLADVGLRINYFGVLTGALVFLVRFMLNFEDRARSVASWMDAKLSPRQRRD